MTRNNQSLKVPGSYARGVYLTQDTSRMETARVKQEEEADKNNSKKSGRKEHRHEEKKTQTRPN